MKSSGKAPWSRMHAAVIGGAILLFICIVDAIWLFGYALPRNPPPARIPSPPATATESQMEVYEDEADRARLREWDRTRIVDSAISVPVVVALCIGMVALLTVPKSIER